jgi:ketosteroid isomerase-like protein
MTTTDRASEIRTIVERYATAWRDGDLATMLDCYHDDVVLHWFGANPLSGDHAGKGVALAALGEFTRRTQRRLVGIVATMAGPERGAIVAREELGGTEVERVLVYTVRDGKLAECWVYDRDPALVDRLVGAA